MIQLNHNRITCICPLIILFLFLIFGNTLVSKAQQPETGVRWSEGMRIPSPEESDSWFPDLAVDREGRAHVIWVETRRPEIGPLDERVYYSMWDGQKWTPFNDILPTQPDIIRNAIAIDNYDVLHLLFDAPGYILNYQQSQASEALSAAAWSTSHRVSTRGFTYMSDIAVYRDILHIVYGDTGAEEGECSGCTDMFYRHSINRGLNWSAPIALFPTGTGSARPQLEIDKTGTIYVAWDEGWDKLGSVGNPESGLYMYSNDGGNTWSAPTIISYPNSTNAQLTVGGDGRGGVMLVWRTTSREYPHIYYMWSTDQGASWSPPQTIPNFFAINWAIPFDIYDMAADSAGHIHLLTTGYLAMGQVGEKPPGLYHFEWDGNAWSAPSPIYEGGWYPEYPHLVIDRGNQLHVTWFVRQDLWQSTDYNQVWYAHGQSQAPAETPVVRPTLTPIPLTPTSTPTLTPIPGPTTTPTPTLDLTIIEAPIPPEDIYAIYDKTYDVPLLLISLIPAILIVTVVVISVRIWRK